MPGVYEGLVRALVLFAAIFALTAVVLAVARRFRDRSAEDRLDPNQLLSNFRELYERGGLSDEEFRTIKAQLADRMQREVSDNEDTG